MKKRILSVSKRGQMNLSFGMIFSIILIIVFISFAFFAIKKFISLSESVQIEKFANDLQNDIDKAWKGSQSSQTREYFLPSKIKYLCLIDYSKKSVGKNSQFYDELRNVYLETENLFFYPIGSAEGLNSKEIKHIDLEKTTATQNPLCFENKENIKIFLKKEYGEALVTIQ